jgi:lipid-binding SYLF domain-containing protein
MAAMLLAATPVLADKYTDTANLFRKAGQSGTFFNKSYGYAVFPTIGKAGFGVGGAYGSGRVYDHGKYVGDTSMTQLSLGFQMGG